MFNKALRVRAKYIFIVRLECFGERRKNYDILYEKGDVLYMKKYFVILFAFLIIDIFMLSFWGQPTDRFKFIENYLIFIFMEVPIYGTLILYEIRKKEDNKK